MERFNDYIQGFLESGRNEYRLREIIPEVARQIGWERDWSRDWNLSVQDAREYLRENVRLLNELLDRAGNW